VLYPAVIVTVIIGLGVSVVEHDGVTDLDLMYMYPDLIIIPRTTILSEKIWDTG
jgi:hypothetical protein